jgi:hypothetical protein
MIHSELPPENGNNPLWITSPRGTPRVIHTEKPPENGSKSLWITGRRDTPGGTGLGR